MKKKTQVVAGNIIEIPSDCHLPAWIPSLLGVVRPPPQGRYQAGSHSINSSNYKSSYRVQFEIRGGHLHPGWVRDSATRPGVGGRRAATGPAGRVAPAPEYLNSRRLWLMRISSIICAVHSVQIACGWEAKLYCATKTFCLARLKRTLLGTALDGCPVHWLAAHLSCVALQLICNYAF